MPLDTSQCVTLLFSSLAHDYVPYIMLSVVVTDLGALLLAKVALGASDLKVWQR